MHKWTDLILDPGELLHGSLGSGGRDPGIDDAGQEGDGRHDRVSGLAERDRLVGQRAQEAAAVLGVLQVGILDGQTQEVEDALVLGSRADVLAHLEG